MGVSNYSMADIANLTNAAAVPTAKNSTSRSSNTELTMQDFLQLMVVQLQNQTIDDTMDTSEMMNQMVQMQMVTAITNMNELSVMSYASSLVNKVVTIGIVEGNSLEEREVLVIGTGMSNGQQVIFGKDSSGKVQTYALNQIMAIGQLPPIEGEEEPGDDNKVPGDGDESGDGDGDVDDVGGGGDGGDGGESSGEVTQPPADQTQAASATYDGGQGAPSDNT